MWLLIKNMEEYKTLKVNKMSYAKTRLENDKRKNKPNIIFPIINTIFATILMGIVIFLFCTSKGSFGIGLFIFCVIILILYPVSSWLNSFVLKKMNLKKINNYEKETEMLIKYVKRYESYHAYELGKDLNINFNIEKTNEIVEGEPLKFNSDTCNLGVPQNANVLLTLGVSFAGIEVNKETKQIMGVAGMLPRSVWYPKKLKAPTPTKAKIKVDFNGFNISNKIVIHALRRADIYYDNKTGWLAVGERKVTVIDDAYEIKKGVIIVLRDQELMSVWLELDPNLLVK